MAIVAFRARGFAVFDGNGDGALMTTPPAPLLILPGIGNSGPDHWQTLWEAHLPQARRVEQADWDSPQRQDWCDAIEIKVRQCEDRPLIVAHSLGCLAAVFWAGDTSLSVAGALLVAPPDPGSNMFPSSARGFSPLPRQPLPFPSIVVASSNDPFAALDFTRQYAAAWNSRWIDVGARGHINAASGLGRWDEGLALLASLGAGPMSR